LQLNTVFGFLDTHHNGTPKQETWVLLLLGFCLAHSWTIFFKMRVFHG